MRKNILNIHIDESGNFGEATSKQPRQYLITMVFHHDYDDINNDVHMLEESTRKAGFDVEYIHSGLLIRKEEVFKNYSLDERRQLIYKIFNFFNHIPITHKTFVIDRKIAKDKVSLSGEIGKQINAFIKDNYNYFSSFDLIQVFYDGGQIELSSILNTVFSIALTNVEFKKAQPQKYRLLQVADFICSLELLRIKFNEKRLSKWEKKFFYKPQELQKLFFKSIDKKRLK